MCVKFSVELRKNWNSDVALSNRSTRHRKHPFKRNSSPVHNFGAKLDPRLKVAQCDIKLLQGVERHIGAHVAVAVPIASWNSNECLVRRGLFHLMDDMGLGRNEDGLRFARHCELKNGFGRTDKVGMIDDMGRTFRVRCDRRAGIFCFKFQKLGLAECLVDNADARPKEHFSPELALEIGSKMPVGTENDLLIEGNLVENLLSTARCDDDIGERFHRSRTIDVGERDVIGMGLAKRFELVGRAES